MNVSVWEEVAYLMVEQYEEMTDHYSKDVPRQIRESAIHGARALYVTCASIFGVRLEAALHGAARAGMDYIAYVDETWIPMGERDRKNTIEIERYHLESVKTVLLLSRMEERLATHEIMAIIAEGERHLNNIMKR